MKNISVNDHVPNPDDGNERCAICRNRPYEHAWWGGWDAILEEPESDEEEAEAEEAISEREPLVEYKT